MAEQVELRGQEDSHALRHMVSELYTSGLLADITLCTKQYTFKAHKLVLLSQCSNLRDDIVRQAEDPTAKVQLDVHPVMLQHVLRYVYTNELSVPKKDLRAVAEAANQLGVQELRSMCTSEALANEPITAKNCLDLWKEAHDIDDEGFLQRVFPVALSNFQLLKKSGGLKRLPADLLEIYLCHQELKVESPEERLGTAIRWFKHDVVRRYHKIIPLLESLPLGEMGKWYLDQMMEDPIVAGHARIKRRLTDVILGRLQVDVPLCNLPTEKCLIVIGGVMCGRRSKEVLAVRLERNYKVLQLGTLEGVYRCRRLSFNPTNFCVRNNCVYACGLGKKCDEIWIFDLLDKSSRQVARLQNSRDCHAVFTAEDNNIYILGGRTISTFAEKDVHSCEVVGGDCRTTIHNEALWFSASFNRLAVSPTSDANLILVYGGMDAEYQHTVQLFNLRKRSVEYSVSIARKKSCGLDIMLGVFVTDDHVISLCSQYAAFCSKKELFERKAECMEVCENYKPPNKKGAVMLSEDKTEIILLGGEMEKRSRSYVYSATVENIVKDTEVGWTHQEDNSWPLGECQMYGGYVIADIPLCT